MEAITKKVLAAALIALSAVACGAEDEVEEDLAATENGVKARANTAGSCVATAPAGVNVRAEASTSATVLGIVACGAAITKNGEPTGGWMSASASGVGSGFVSTDWVKCWDSSKGDFTTWRNSVAKCPRIISRTDATYFDQPTELKTRSDGFSFRGVVNPAGKYTCRVGTWSYSFRFTKTNEPANYFECNYSGAAGSWPKPTIEFEP